MPEELRIEAVDVHDEAALRRFHAVQVAAVGAGRPHAFSRGYDALAASWRNPTEYFSVHPMWARRGDEVLGVVDVELPERDNTHFAEVEVAVLPEHRRGGVGRALLAAADGLVAERGRTTCYAETYVVGDADEAPGLAFARACGFESVTREDHLILALPVPGDVRTAWPVAPGGYEVLTWRERCPDDLLEAYCRMRNRMNADVPSGETDHAPVVMTPERIRAGEERLAASYRQVVAAVRATAGEQEGELAGYTVVFVPRGEDRALQDDTLVMPEHRGRGLALALKAATLGVVEAEHPEVRSLHTWTEVDNAPMLRTNARFGYRAAERMHGVQRMAAHARAAGTEWCRCETR